jgi:two-component system, sensor histidine kinase PdtaS
MIETDSIMETLARALPAAGADTGKLEALGAHYGSSGVSLPTILSALPDSPAAGHIASALAAGYLRARSQSDEHDAARLRLELHRRRSEINALQRVNTVATSSLDESTVLNKVVDAVADVVGVAVCSIYLLQGSSGLLLAATYGLNRSAVGTARLSLGEGLIGWAAQHCQTTNVSDIWGDARAKYLPETEEDPYHSILAVPIMATGGEAVLGVITVQTRQGREFTADEITFLEMVAGQLALSIENARSYGQTDARLRQKVAALTTLHQIVVAVAGSLELRRVLDTVAEQAVTLGQCDGSIILTRKAQQQHLRTEARWGVDLQEQYESIERLALASLQQRSQRTDMLPCPGSACGRSIVCEPLRGHGSTFGVLVIVGKPEQSFDGETRDMLDDFASVAALAIENAQLHQATRQNLEAKSVLLAELHHRVKNNLQTVASLLSLALRHSKSDEASNTLRESYNRVRSIAAAHDLLSRQAIGVTTIEAVARKVIELLEPTVKERGAIRFTAEGESIELETREATTLAILLNELLTNAVRHGLRGREQGTVRVLYGRQASQVWVTVADDGNGLPPDFSLGKNKGLGLSIVRTLVEADLHGQVDWGGEQGAGFTLLFTPPVGSTGRFDSAARG